MSIRINFQVALTLLIILTLPVVASDLFSTEEFPKTDFSRHTVPLSEIYSAGPSRDRIRPIDKPVFVTIAKAGEYMDSREPVASLTVNGQSKAYPLRILLYHEIVNDRLGGTPVVITHCPLCNTALAFHRHVNGHTLDFGTTGRVRNSNMVMYDRQSESWWQQFTGDGIIGKYAGTELEALPSQIISFEQFSSMHPEGKVLSQRTGQRRYYGKTPYPGYDDPNGNPYLYRQKPDPRLPPLIRILGLASDDSAVAYPFTYLAEHSVINTEFDDQPVAIFSRAGLASTVDRKVITDSKDILSAAAYSRTVNNRTLDFDFTVNGIVDSQTRSEWNILGTAINGPLKGKQLEQIDQNVHFAFAWLAFYPHSEIIE